MINIDQFQLIIKENIIFDTSDKKYSIMPIWKKWKKWLFWLFFWKSALFSDFCIYDISSQKCPKWVFSNLYERYWTVLSVKKSGTPLLKSFLKKSIMPIFFWGLRSFFHFFWNWHYRISHHRYVQNQVFLNYYIHMVHTRPTIKEA